MNDDVQTVISSFMDDFTLLIFSLLSKKTYTHTKRKILTYDEALMIHLTKDEERDKEIGIVSNIDIQSFGIRTIDVLQVIRDPELTKEKMKLIMRFYGTSLEQYCRFTQKSLFFMIQNKQIIKYLALHFGEHAIVGQLESYKFTKRICKTEKDLDKILAILPDKYLNKTAMKEIRAKKITKKRIYHISF